MLKVKSYQSPLAPTYATIAHFNQGRTLRDVLLGLQVDKRVDATFGSVADSRAQCRKDVLITRPFPRRLYERGSSSDGPVLLLKKLRGESINWAAAREAPRPCAACSTPSVKNNGSGFGYCKQIQPVQNLQRKDDSEAPQANCRQPAEILLT